MARPASQAAEDLAFADTVVADEELNSVIPSSRPGAGDEAPDSLARSGERRRVTARPPPRETVQSAWDEMHDLWSAARSIEVASRPPEAAASTVRTLGRRLRTLWSFFEWERKDLVRALVIGAVAFVAFGATALVLLLGR